MSTMKLMPTQVRVSITNCADGLYQLFVLGEGARVRVGSPRPLGEAMATAYRLSGQQPGQPQRLRH